MYHQSKNSIIILFDWENLSFDDLYDLCKTLHIKNIRWLAIHHPDNKTRENLYRLSNVEVGKKTTINMGLFIHSMKKMVFIGSNCALAANISLIPESNPNLSELKDLSIIKEHYIKEGNIIIEDHCWIGAGVIIFPGVTIGHHSVIGAGTIVTRSMPAYSIVKGQPGKVVKTINFSGVI